MPSLTNFDAWLASLPLLGYDRDWVRRNLPALERTFHETGGAPMQPCPPEPVKRHDRYGEL